MLITIRNWVQLHTEDEGKELVKGLMQAERGKQSTKGLVQAEERDKEWV
jgi:hypothetical protein